MFGSCFTRGRDTVFHTGAARSANGELQQLARQAQAANLSTLRDLARRPYVDWDDALDHLAEAARDEPLLLVLDEYQELERTAVGPWWRHDGRDQIDAVALAGPSPRGSAGGEAKWSKAIDGRRTLQRLRAKPRASRPPRKR